VKLNELFDNEHRRDGNRSSTEIYHLAKHIASDEQVFWSRNEQDLAALVIELNYAYMAQTRAALVYRDLLRAAARRSSYWRGMLFTQVVTRPARRLFTQGAPRATPPVHPDHDH